MGCPNTRSSIPHSWAELCHVYYVKEEDARSIIETLVSSNTSGRDRKLFCSWLDGLSAAEIATKFELSSSRAYRYVRKMYRLFQMAAPNQVA